MNQKNLRDICKILRKLTQYKIKEIGRLTEVKIEKTHQCLLTILLVELVKTKVKQTKNKVANKKSEKSNHLITHS